MQTYPHINRKDFLGSLFSFSDRVFDPAAFARDRMPLGVNPSYIRVKREAMYTDFEVIFGSNENGEARRTAFAVLNEIDRVERLLTIWRGWSELMELNRRAAIKPVKVSREIFSLVKLARQIYLATTGAYDISSTPLSRCWGFFQRKGRVPSDEELRNAKKRVGMEFVELDEEKRTVFFRKQGIELSPASLGKGFALDRAILISRKRGLRNVMLSGGFSSVFASGAPAWKDRWNLSIRNPMDRNRSLARIGLVNQGYSSSGSEAQRFTHNSRVYGHILDPRTGRPVHHMENVNVIASTAAEAEALSTAFYVMGVEKTLQFCEKHPTIGVVIVTLPDSRGKSEIVTANIDETRMEVLEQ